MACCGLLLGVGCVDLPGGDGADAGPGFDVTAPPEPPDASDDDGGPVEPGGTLNLTLSAIEPDRGPVSGGRTVQITGTGFAPGMVVLIDESLGIDLEVESDTRASFVVPPHPAGAVDVSVWHPASQSPDPVVLEAAYLYQADLVITGVDPPTGDVAGGSTLTVHGDGFTEGARFFVDGRAAISPSRVDAQTLVGVLPPGSFGLVDVHVVAGGETAVARDAFTYGTAPRVDVVTPVSGPASGGTHVRISGHGMDRDAVVRFGEHEAPVADAAADGSWLETTAPAGPAGTLADVAVSTPFGEAVARQAFAWLDPEADPYLLACSHAFPASGPEQGGTLVELGCTGLDYGVEVSFGATPAEVVLAQPTTSRLVVRAPAGAAGSTDITVTSPFDAVTLTEAFQWLAEPDLQVTSVSPASGSVSGGTVVEISGRGFGADASVRIGALEASAVVRLADGTLRATAPPGSPGSADVVVRSGGSEAVLPGGYSYTDGTLSIALVAPSVAAKAGGTFLRVIGDGFDEATTVQVGGEAAPLIERVSAAELHVRSPRLEVGVWDAVARAGGTEARRDGALTVFDPRTGFGGTSGGVLDGALNVTVRGSQGVGAVGGAFVTATTADGRTLSGYTNDEGQVTLSEPWLDGEVRVTAAAVGFTAYSVVHFDAANVTIFLRPLVPPPPPTTGGGGGGSNPPPPAVVSGQVIGLGKYVIPPPGRCSISPAEGGPHCAICGSDAACGAEGFACVDLLEQGSHCLAECQSNAECPNAYVCGPTSRGARCVPDPGELIARCGFTASSVFATDIFVPTTGWVSPGGTYELPTNRFDEVAVVCFGGYRDLGGYFTPTAMGVRRHLITLPGLAITGQDIVLDHRLNRTFRLRLMDPPTWPAGVQPPSITISLDLGADGVIPFTRVPLPAPDHTWRAPRQLSTLDGDIYDGRYTFYTTISATSDVGLPKSYNLVQEVTSVSESRFPVLTDGEWTLEETLNEVDLNAIWAADPDRVLAVGGSGRIMLRTAGAWTQQSSGTSATLRALAGRGPDDVYAVGDEGTVRRWGGLGWHPVDAPMDDYHAAATAPGQPLLVAGELRVRAVDAQGGWTVEGPPWLQAVRGLWMGEDGRALAVGLHGRAAQRSASGVWSPMDSGTEADLAAITVHPQTGEILAVGAHGTVLTGAPGASALAAVELGVSDDLTAVAVTADGAVVVVGDNGRALRRVGGVWVEDRIPDYRSRATGIYAPPDGGPVRVVGGAAFILGPFLHFPVIEAATEGPDGEVTLNWDWDGGPAAEYSQLVVYDELGPDLWTLVVDGSEREAPLPALELLAGIDGLGSGSRVLEVLRARNEGFDIDAYTTREFSIFRRSSWALNRGGFFAP
ncbi:MAG: IPT/TIG domain-containing protein [Deltaproteobacteria bacterium]|nr:IPT/TIG domain-containing protein [Deltaproteobacteria bacterium]MCB9786338.1 IPT/TIG domain-containing protein [Deltaproteobacteria bacterium]